MDAPSDPENPVNPEGKFDWTALSQKTWVIVLSGLLMPPDDIGCLRDAYTQRSIIERAT